MGKNLTAVVDIDWCKYSVAATGQTNSIVAVHKQSGDEYNCSNRTEFWGGYKRKAGGLLCELNKGRDSPLLPEEFDIKDTYALSPVENVLHSAKTMVESNIKRSGANKYVAFLGEGVSFREDLSTLQRYKNRTAPKPHYLGEVTEYLKKKFSPIVVSGLEADDHCVMEAYGKEDHYVLGEDKDYYSCPVRFFNVNEPQDGIVDCALFGGLDRKVNTKGKLGKVIGRGRSHLYHQVLYGDDVDTYHAAFCSEYSMGTVKAYNMLKGCSTDRECWEVLVGGFKYLYPEPKTIKGWRGDDMDIDWIYCLQEMFDMAHMVRWEGDRVLVKDVLDKLGVVY